ncbi:DNA-binding winged helix-turn-helix (wHTH) domain-containing protein [Arsukibacterium tuosuense]|uniref:DNA-binding winged helix-turn-helix (WHTH) domain-containing protein n=1 Tax=Arsukibacterium tuosuense TaxID=1323745 RepID=A0A285IYU4_9GAMM|nr:winged helix-turn-helix domain-containing protein [Arsukibacterium tuosuense]SNY52983.1 DNA-binding winged helix-turn-helix (wHTH) domain-containing protein [Arsukibacterium tuosuense]
MSNLEPLVKIGDWYYQAAYGQLLPAEPDVSNAVPVVLEPRLHSLLNYFLLHPNQILDKDTLINDVWPPAEGTDAAVMRAVGALRKVLGDNVKSPTYIATIAKKGYQWLCQIEPLTSQQRKPLPGTRTLTATELTHTASDTEKGLPWRFISAVCNILLLGGAALAYVLASVTVTPLTQLPDTVKPLSALTGQEFWATLEPGQQYAFYWHRKSEAAPQQLARQDLTSLKVNYNEQRYPVVSQPLWLDNNQLVFRAQDSEQHCYFYQQQVMPDFMPASKVMPCQQVLTQGLAILARDWYWLDYDADLRRYELWRRAEDGNTTRLMAFEEKWHKVDQLLVVGSALYLVARQDFYRSRLYQVNLEQKQLEKIADFDQQIITSSSWDKQHALLTLKNSELQLYNLKSKKQLSLGPMTWDLTQPQRYQERILSTQYLDYTTDIVLLTLANQQLTSERSWQTSNRNERLFAANGEQIAFVSERAGDNQVWLSQGRDSRQLSRLSSGQYIQQVFWHQDTLLSVIDNQLYQIALEDGSLSLINSRPVSGHYQSCDDILYWTEQTSDGWQLMAGLQQPEVLLSGVVNLKCAPAGLVVQFYNDSTLAFWSASQPQQLSPLPVSLNWHHILPEQWTSTERQLLWLDRQQWRLKVYDWQSGEISSYPWPATALPLEIHSDNTGNLFSVQPRHYDTDIVWLQNRS